MLKKFLFNLNLLQPQKHLQPMKLFNQLAAWLFIFCSVGCIRDEDQLVVQSCEAFNFGIQESNWILFPEGNTYSFKSGDKIIEIASEYRISEPYTLEYERRPIFSLFPDGQVRNCFSYFESYHNSENRSLTIKECSLTVF